MDKYSLRAQLDLVEISVIQQARSETQGDGRAASRLLPYSERTLWGRIERLGIDPSDHRTMQIVADSTPVTS